MWKQLRKVIENNFKNGIFKEIFLFEFLKGIFRLAFFTLHFIFSCYKFIFSLEPITLDKKTVTCPFIDVIDFETFAYRAQDEGARGAFDWELYYKRLPLLPEDLQRPTEPFKLVLKNGLF